MTLNFLSKKFSNAKSKKGLKVNEENNNSLVQPLDPENLEFFKTVVVNKQNMELIIGQLKATASQRCGMIKEMKLDFLEQFPIFFTHPNLVSSIKNCINLFL